MNKSLLSMVLLVGFGFSGAAHALSINPKSVHAVVEDRIYRGGTTGGSYGTPVTDFQFACENNFTLVVNAYSNAPAKQVTCEDGRQITYIGDHWKNPAAGRDDLLVEEVRRSGKVLVHCRYGVDASQEVAYIIAARAGLMPVEEAADRFLKAPAGTPHKPMIANILKRGQ
jgi:hypothetical protein